MSYPPRLAHLATKKVVLAKLAPTYARAHQVDMEEALDRLDMALAGPLMEDLLSSTWQALKATSKRPDEAALLEKVADTLADRPQRPGREAGLTPALSAFMVLLDIRAGTAGDAARRVLEREEGKKMVQAGLGEAGALLARELTRGR